MAQPLPSTFFMLEEGNYKVSGCLQERDVALIIHNDEELKGKVLDVIVAQTRRHQQHCDDEEGNHISLLSQAFYELQTTQRLCDQLFLNNRQLNSNK
jgi:hypothetical protein